MKYHRKQRYIRVTFITLRRAWPWFMWFFTCNCNLLRVRAAIPVPTWADDGNWYSWCVLQPRHTDRPMETPATVFPGQTTGDVGGDSEGTKHGHFLTRSTVVSAPHRGTYPVPLVQLPGTGTELVQVFRL